MNILMTADTVGGVWTYALELTRALAPHGVSVTLATMGGAPSDFQTAEAVALPNLNLICSDFRLEWMENPWNDVARAGDWLLDIEHEIRPDVVHLNNFAHGPLPWRAPTLMVGHSCVLSWWRAVKGENAPGGDWQPYRETVQAGLRAVDAIAVPTHAMGETLTADYGPFAKPMHRVMNGRDCRHFRSDVLKETFVLTAGRLWDEAKNVAALAAIAPVLPTPIYVAGDNVEPGRNNLDGVSDAVRWLGRLEPPKLAEWMARAAVYALPARYEPFGLSALEAALSGCALVLGDIPSLREVWGDAALFVAPDDTASLRTSIELLLTDTARRRELAAAGLKRAQKYTAARMASQYLGIYQSLRRHRKEESLVV